MKINPKLTGALAWTGLVLVLAVPAANMLTGEPEAKANLTSDTRQVQTATAKPAGKPVVPAVESKPSAVVETASAGDGAVTDFVKSGKKMPSYISGGDSPAVDTASTPKAPAAKPGTITINPDGTIKKPTTVPALTPVRPDVASVEQPVVAPTPLPASARPKPQTVTTLPAPAEQPLIIDENAVASTGPLPPSDIVPDDQLVTGDQLEEWDSGSLADYLERKGLMSDASQAAPATDERFFIEDAPNNRRSRVIIY